MSVEFTLAGYPFVGLNGGPHFKFTPATSFQIHCEDQAEVDHYWDKLTDGGDPSMQRCGWCSDKFGISWQVIPRRFGELTKDGDITKVGRMVNAMQTMRKLDVAELEKAFNGDN